MKTNVYLIVGITLFVLVLLYTFKKENFATTIVPPVVTTAPTQVQNALAIQQAHANNLGADIGANNGADLANDLMAIIVSQESPNGGLSSFDYYTGKYLGNWTMVMNGDACVWNYTGILATVNPDASMVSSTSILLPADYPQNCYWTLFPNHSAGKPVLRKITTASVSQYENNAWVVIENL